MLQLTQRPQRIFQSIIATALVTAVFSVPTLFAQGKKGTTSSTVTYKQTIVVAPNAELTTLHDGRAVYTIADPMPEYPGDLQAFLAANLRYPEEARKQKIEGRSVVRFIVSSDGSISDAQIIHSSGNQQLDDEALRVVGMMQPWKPGMRAGSPVAVFFNLPVSYKLD